METVEYMRFTLEEVRAGRAAGWRFHAGWFVRASGLTWAWYVRELGEEDG